jgi:chromosomal replication initiator protein
MSNSSPYSPRRRLQSSLRQIQELVADYYALSPGELLGRSRTRELSAARHLAIYLAHEITGASLPALGEAFQRDHTTVLYALRRVGADLGRDPCAVAALEALRQQLKAAPQPREENQLVQLHRMVGGS